MRKKRIKLLLLMGCLLFGFALLPNRAVAEDVLPHHPTQGTAVIVVTNILGSGVVGSVTSDLQGAGYAVSLLDPDNSTAANLRTGLSAGVIVWIGHGNYVGGQVILGTPEYAFEDNERELRLLYAKYKEDFDSGRVVWQNVTIEEPGETFTVCYVWIAPSFISFYYAGDTAFPNSLWYTCSCYSLADNSMAQAFLDSEGAVYMGWTKSVSVSYGNSATMDVIDQLSNGDTVDEVVSEGYVDPGMPHAALDYEGDGEFSLLLNLVVEVPQATDGVNVWVDGVLHTSPVNIKVGWGQHTIEVQAAFLQEAWKPGYFYIYTFHNWSDGSTDNPRTVYLTDDATFTAYYLRSKHAIL